MNREGHTILLIFQIRPSWDLVLCSNHKKKTSSALDFKSRVLDFNTGPAPNQKKIKCFTFNLRSVHFADYNIHLAQIIGIIKWSESQSFSVRHYQRLITSCYHIFCEIQLYSNNESMYIIITSKWAMNVSAVHKRKAVFFSSPMRTNECLGVPSAFRLVKWNIPMKFTFNNQSTCGGAMLSQDEVKSDKLLEGTACVNFA